MPSHRMNNGTQANDGTLRRAWISGSSRLRPSREPPHSPPSRVPAAAPITKPIASRTIAGEVDPAELQPCDVQAQPGGPGQDLRGRIRVRDRPASRLVVGLQHLPDDPGMRRLEILAHEKRAGRDQVLVAIQQDVVILQLRLGHERVQAGPRIDLAKCQRLPTQRMLQRHHRNVPDAEPRRLQRAQQEDAGIGPRRGGDPLPLQVGQAGDPRVGPDHQRGPFRRRRQGDHLNRCPVRAAEQGGGSGRLPELDPVAAQELERLVASLAQHPVQRHAGADGLLEERFLPQHEAEGIVVRVGQAQGVDGTGQDRVDARHGEHRQASHGKHAADDDRWRSHPVMFSAISMKNKAGSSDATGQHALFGVESFFIPSGRRVLSEVPPPWQDRHLQRQGGSPVDPDEAVIHRTVTGWRHRPSPTMAMPSTTSGLRAVNRPSRSGEASPSIGRVWPHEHTPRAVHPDRSASP